MAKAMNLTFGDLIIVEIALVHYIRDLDLSMQCGRYLTELMGKVEYLMAEINQAAAVQLTPNLNPTPEAPGPTTP